MTDQHPDGMNPYAPPLTDVADEEPQLVDSGSITIDESTELPMACVLCGGEAHQFHVLTVVVISTIERSLSGKLLMTLLTILDVFFSRGIVSGGVRDERPIMLSLPICRAHVGDRRLGQIETTSTGARQATVSRIHPSFIAATNAAIKSKWAQFARNIEGK